MLSTASLWLQALANVVLFLTMSSPIYATAALLSIVTAYASDRLQKRFICVFGFQLVIMAGFVIALAGSATSAPAGVIYVGVFIAACGIYPAFPGAFTWIANNMSPSYKRSVGMAIQLGLGNFAGGQSV